MTRHLRICAMGLIAAVGLAGCQSTDPYTGQQKTSNTAVGGGVGAITGAIIGAAVSSKSDRGKGALIGAAVGGLAGAGVGNYMDKQEAQLRQQLQGSGVSVTRNGDNIILNMPGNITFDTARDQVKSQFYPTLDSVALVLKEFDETKVLVAGHTDSIGTAADNQALSERRAMNVAKYLVSQNLSYQRVTSVGYGESQPIADNMYEAGRSQNRRVELTLTPMVR